MSQEIDIYSNNDLAPYQPGTGLQPISPQDDWSVEPDFLAERPASPSPLPQNVEQNVAQIASVFETDMASLGYVQRDIDKCIGWFRNSLVNPVQRMPQKKHSYNLWQYSHDPVMNAFANYAHQQKFSQNLIQSICYWVQQFEDLQHGVGRFSGTQQVPVSSDPTETDQLTDSQYEQVLVANERAIANTMGYLRDLWGSSYAANLRVVQNYFSKLPTAEQKHLEQYSSGWIVATNTPEVLLGLYRQAIGAGSLPKSGADISREIASIENVMKTERAKYMKDDQLQARYRELLRMRGY